MDIQISGKNYILRRYAGISDGKSISVKVGSIPSDTSPQAIPLDVVENLTPKELEKLQSILRKAESQRAKEKALTLAGDVNDVACAIESDLLEEDTIRALVKACKALVKSAKRYDTPKQNAAAIGDIE